MGVPASVATAQLVVFAVSGLTASNAVCDFSFMHDPQDKTARCILVSADGFLLVQHSNCSPPNRGKWGLPGGHLQVDESARGTLRRELMEELFIEVSEFELVGRYRYKDRWHRIFSANLEDKVERWDPSEIATVQWYSGRQVDELEKIGKLHAGFEAEAIRAYGAASASKDSSASAGEREVGSSTRVPSDEKRAL